MSAYRKTRPDFEWTDEACDLLRKRWAEGCSASEVARELGLASRSAVCGKANRLGLTHTRTEEIKLNNIRRLTPKGTARRTRLPKPPKPPVYVNVRNVVHNIEARKRDPGQRAMPAAERTFPHAKPWLERSFGECAFPVGEGADTLSCSAPTDRTYCRDCQAVMFQPMQPTMKKTMRLSRLAA